MNYNNYLELIEAEGEKSDKNGDLKDVSMLDKMKPDISGKQMVNKTRMTMVGLKKKAQ